jgi:hypothetical protein
MSALLIAGGAAVFGVGAAIGSALTLALAKDKLAAMTEAAERANAIITTQSEGALKDLADAHSRAEAMIDAIETAKLSTARAETSVTNLISKIHHSRTSLEKVARLDWFPSMKRADAEKRAMKAEPAHDSSEQKPRFGFFSRKEDPPIAAAAE